MKIPYNYVAVEGSIGAGKTTLVEMLSKDMDAEPIYERFAENPFLPKFYKEPHLYAFPLEMTFLMDRYQQLKAFLPSMNIFADFTIGDYFIDKCLLFSKNNLDNDEFMLFKSVFDALSSQLPHPDLIIYLYSRPERLLKQIAKRGRSYESGITDTYLSDIQEKYLTYFRENASVPILLVDTENIDFVENPDDYLSIKSLLARRYEPGIHRILF